MKIKCDEAKPSCEYCTHTGRVCEYPDSGKDIINSTPRKLPLSQNRGKILHLDIPSITFSEGKTPISPAESYEASIYGQNDGIDTGIYETLLAKNSLAPRAYNLMATQLQMSRFELRLLRFFHDQCIPYVTFNANRKARHIWRNIFPQYFASLDLVRQATYAMACLNLWPIANLQGLLQSDQLECLFEITPLDPLHLDNAFSHVFDKLAVFENSGESIFLITTAYFLASLQTSQQFVGETQQKNALTYEDLASLYFSGFLIFAYVGIHPHCVLPLIDDETSYPSDFIGFFSSMRKVFLLAAPSMREDIIENLMEYDFLTPTENSEKIGFVEVLRLQLSEYHFANTAFSEIGAAVCAENHTLQKCLFILECCYLAAIREGHPTPFFKFLVLLEDDFIALARRKDHFARRVLFTFSCICVYCQFYLLFNENVWAQYIETFTNESIPMCASDQALYDHVVTRHQFADPNKFSHEMRVLNRHSFVFGGMAVPNS